MKQKRDRLSQPKPPKSAKGGRGGVGVGGGGGGGGGGVGKKKKKGSKLTSVKNQIRSVTRLLQKVRRGRHEAPLACL